MAHNSFRREAGFATKKVGSTIFFDTDGSVGYNLTPRTFYIYGTYIFKVTGDQFRKTTLVTNGDFVQIANTTGLHSIYYDLDGVLHETTSIDLETLFYTKCLVAVVYWNASDSIALLVEDERHGSEMDWETHIYLHEYFRTQYVSGLGLNDITPDASGNLDTSAQFSVENGVVEDEDVEHAIIDGSPQNLSPIPANIPILFRSGATAWRIKTADNFPLVYSDGVFFTGANDRCPYNQNVGGNWQFTEVAEGKYVLVHYFASNNIYNPIMGIQGQAEYTTQPLAYAGAENELAAIVLAGLPSLEFKFIGTVIFQTSSGYANGPRARIRSTGTNLDYVDWRVTVFTPGGLVGAAAPSQIYDIEPLPIGWAIDGGVAPGAIAILNSTNKARYRDFSGSANNDVFFEWIVPYGIDLSIPITFQVEGWITNATAPANGETAKFLLSGVSIADSELLSSAQGSAITVTKTFDATFAQYDRWISEFSGNVTIAGLDPGEIVIFKLSRDITDTYAQDIGVGWLKIKFRKVLQVL